MKPKQWIERFPVHCADDFHVWLMDELGFEEYLRQRAWELTLWNLSEKLFASWHMREAIKKCLHK